MTGRASDTLRHVAAAALQDTDALTARVLHTVTSELPELAQEPRVRDLLATTVGDNVVSALRLLASDEREVVDVAPPVALDFARRLAQQGVPITAMVRAYRLGQACFQQEVLSRIADQHVSGEEVAAAAMELSAIAFAFIDTVSESVVAAYQQEREAWLRHRNAARLSNVVEVLAGALTELATVEARLGYRVTRTHVGALLWVPDGTEQPDALGTLERAVAAMATALRCTGQPLSVASDASTLWVWFPAASVDVVALERVVATVGDDVRAALGEPAAGLDGWRATHLQARQAQAVALAARPSVPRRVTAAAQLGPLALLSPDVPAIAAWVRSVLGALADDDEPHARMRETAWAYLSSGGSLNSAASELHLHRNTIQYRIGKAEEARGRPFGEGRLDVEVALLACAVLGSVVLRPAADGDG